MENKNQASGEIPVGQAMAEGAVHPAPEFMGSNANALSLEDPMPSEGTSDSAELTLTPRRFWRSRRLLFISVICALLVGAVVFLLLTSTRDKETENASLASRFDTIRVPLNKLVDNLPSAKVANVTINGAMQLNGSFGLTPTLQPTGAKPGDLYYDKTINQLAYFNGSAFVFLTEPPEGGVQSLGGVTGPLTLGNGLALTGSQLSNSGVLSVQGKTGNVAFTPGAGILINGATFTNSGVLAITAGTPNVSVQDNGNGNITLSVSSSGGTGTITSSGGAAGVIPLFTTAQNIENSIISQSGLAVTVAGDLNVTSALSLGAPLAVGSGGIGASVLTANGVLVGQGAAAISSVVAGSAGLCLLSTSGAPTWGACPGGAGSVASLNGLTGALSIANASGTGSSITIDNASTTTKGIASFNGTNFTVSSGAVNTIQDIDTGATPSFAGLNTNAINPLTGLSVGVANRSLVLQGNATTTLSASNGASSTTLSFQSPTATVTYRLLTAPAGTYDVCTSTGNCASAGGGVTTSGGTTNRLAKFSGTQIITDSTLTDDGTNVITSVDMVIQGGDLTIGVPTTQTGTINLAHNGSSFLGSLVQGALSANRSYTLPDASGTLCLSSGNCPNTGVTSLNGLIGSISIANATGAGGTITIADATTSTKGIASFDNSNFTVVGGAVNTIQDIHSSAVPTFAGVNTDAINPVTGLTIGSTANTLLLQGDSSTALAAYNGSNSTTVNFQAPTANVVYRFLTAPAGTYDICTTTGNCAGSGGGVTTPGGTANKLAKFSNLQTIADSTITDNGTTVSTSVDMVVQGGGLTVGTTIQTGIINLARGGTGFQGSILQGALTANRTYTLPDATGTFCLSSGNCPSSGVTSLNSLTGALTIANATAAGSTITINDASTTVKGIASFDSTNFSVNNGAVNTAQNIHTGATPTFAGVNTSTITPGGAMTLGATTQTALLRGSATTITSNGAGNDIILTSADTIELQGTTNVTGNIDVSGALTTGTANAFQVAANGNITTTGTAVVSGASLTIGSASQLGTLTLHDGAGQTGGLQVATLGQATTYILPDPGAASATICLTTGNCSGAAGGVTTAGGTTNRLAKFSGAQTIADSTITDNGTAVTTSVDLTIQGGDVTVGVASSQTGTINFAHSGSAFLGSLLQGALTANRTYTLPDETGTFCLRNSANCGFALSSGSGNYIQNQSAADQTGDFRITGTGRANTSLQAPLFDTATAVALNIGTTNATAITLQKGTTVASGDFNVTTGTYRIAGTAGASVTCSSGNVLQNATVSGGIVTGGSCVASGGATTLQGAYDNSSSPASILLADAKDLVFTAADTATDPNILFNLQCVTSCSTNGRFAVQVGGTDAFTVSPSTGAAVFKNASNTTAGFQVQNSSSTALFTVDTSNARLYVGPTAGDTTGTILVLGNKTNAGDPTGVEGAMYYNSSSKSFRCYMNGRWRSCVAGVLFANTSVPAANTINGTNLETDFGSTYDVPANDCQPGRVYKITASGTYTTLSASPGTLMFRLRYAGTILVSAANAVTAGLNDRAWRAEYQFVCQTAGTSGTIDAEGMIFMSTSNTAAQVWGLPSTAPTTVDTTISQPMNIAVTWSVASSSNKITLRQFIVEASGP